MKRTRKSKGVYWWLDVSGAEGKPIPKKIIEASHIQDFLDWYNKLNKSDFSIRDNRPKKKQERPDFLCLDNSAEWIAIEYTTLFDDPRVVAKNMREAQKPNFDPLKPGAVLKTIFNKNDLKKVIYYKDRSSFVNIPYELNCSKKIVVINIEESYAPEELVGSILREKSIVPRFKNITNVFLMWYEKGAPGQWTCRDITDRI